MPKKPLAEHSKGPGNTGLTAQLHNLVLGAAGKDDALKELLAALFKAVGSQAAAALLFSPVDHSFHIAEHHQLGKKQRRGLEAFLPSLVEIAGSEDDPALPESSHGTVFVFSESEAKRRGFSSALVYYLVRSEQLLGAFAFCGEEDTFGKPALRALDRASGLLSLIIENRFYKERVIETDGIVNLDGLTGLYNHRNFQETLANELLKSQRFDHAVSLLLIDVDHFKKVNDLYGHPQGDAVLKEIAQILKKTVRAYDAAARYGGEEFAVILPHADQTQALQVAERIRKTVAGHQFRGKKADQPLQITVSIGVASTPLNAKTKAELIDRADQALYLAKSEGRNRTSRSLANSSEPIRVGFCPASLGSAYYQGVLGGMEDVVQELKQIELSTRAPKLESDYAMLPGLLEELLEEKPDAVALCTQSPHAVEDLKLLHAAKVPVFLFNVPEKIKDRKIRSYVGYDQVEAGKTVANYLARLLRGRGQIAIIEGLPEPTSRLRVQGFKKALSAFPEMKIVASEAANWSNTEAKRCTSALLKAHPNLDALFAVNDAMALGATSAAKTRGKLGRLFVVGLDGTKDALESIKNGELTATLDTRPREMGRILLRTIVRSLILEEKVSTKIESPINIVTIENVHHALHP